ncbi:MAG TPA: Asp-tRNA(Asn)/Glu-tRNA(Gln) amidotransferase subunit GatA, partial [Niastella sp.]
MFKYHSIAQYHQDLLSGTTTCIQAVQHYLQQIDARKHLNAYVNTYAEEALQRAKELDASRQAGK